MPVGRRSERRLIQQVRAGRRKACVSLVEANYARVYRFLLHMTGDTSLAEDLTQETFAAAWVKIGDFRGRGSVRTWLHRIAYSKFVDSHRARRRWLALSQRLAAQCTQRSDPGASERLVATEDSCCLHRAVQMLPEDGLLVVVLHYFQGMSFREMAEVLGEPPGTVKWRTSRALSRLRKLLGPEADLESPSHTTAGKPEPRGAGGGLARPASAPSAGES